MKKNSADYYNKIWAKYEGYQMSEDLARVGYDWLRKYPGKKCLDIGCGDGTNVKELLSLGLVAEGCDISKIAIDKALRNGIKANVVDLNESTLPYKNNSFDIIWFSEVVEHVNDPDTLLSEISRILKNNGLLFITTPNIAWWGNRIQLLMGRTLYDIHPEHIHWFNSSRLNYLLKENNFVPLQAISYRRLFPYPLTLKVPFLKKFDRVGFPHNLLSFSLGTLAKNKKSSRQ